MTSNPKGINPVHVDNNKPLSHKVVVSGMSGLFPKSNSVKEFSEIVYNKTNPVTSDDCRWNFKHPEVSNFTGKIRGTDRFDNQFFKVHSRQATCMDPGCRKMMEQAYQALYDAGVNPSSLMNKNVGVFVCTSILENESSVLIDTVCKTGAWLTGYSKAMFANRISYWLGTKRPSLMYDANSSGSFQVLSQAYEAIKSGQCESAIVGGVNLCVLPQTTVNARRCYLLAPDGKTKSFDESADGCARSEALCILYLQKEDQALRIYGELVHVQTEFTASKLKCETLQVFGFIRNPASTAGFLKRFYEEAKVTPQDVEYIEGLGTATPEADKAELQAIEKVLCENRNDSLYIGSVLSNIGFTDGAAGMVALTKVLLGYHHGKIASNLHCDSPRKDVAGLREGRMHILREHLRTRYGFIAINGMSVTGLNAHALLKGNFKAKDSSRYKSSFPHLITITARQADFIQSIFDDFKLRPIDPEELALLHNIHSAPISGHLGKGYIILDTNKDQNAICFHEVAEHKDDMNRPLWFVYSGMGSQWSGMGTQLLRIPIFAAAIERCDKVLKPMGVDIVDIITSPNKTIFDNVLNSFVGIAAIQIGLTDILSEIGLKPDKIIGHSVGELGCAYADGCLTSEEMILSAYARGHASNEGAKSDGAMAAIGMGFTQIFNQCPPEIDVACHNSPDSCTISGPAKKVKEFVTKLVSEGVFAREVPSSNIAYHSRYIAEAEASLRHFMHNVIKTPKLRSEKWLSTSVPQEKWDKTASKYCSSDYFINNFLSPVLFEETSKLIPSDAVVVEIAPHGLLQAILKRSLSGCSSLPLTLRNHKDNAVFLLNAIGKIFLEGFYVNLQNLYTKVDFPVSTGTPHLSHHIKWNHVDIMPTLTHLRHSVKKSSCCQFKITIHDEEYSYIRGNVVQGNITYPFVGALVAVWDVLSMSLNSPKKQIPVHFKDVHFFSQPIMHKQRLLDLDVTLHRSSGEFEAVVGKSKVVTGYILPKPNMRPFKNPECGIYEINSDEIYQQLSTLGYSYQNEFKSINAVNKQLTKAQLLWKDNWVTLIDGLIQLNILKQNCSSGAQPNYINEMTIDVNAHLMCVEGLPIGLPALNAEVDDIYDTTRCAGIEMRNIRFINESVKVAEELSFHLYTPPNYSHAINNNCEENIKITKKKALKEGTVMALNLENGYNLEDLKWEKGVDISNPAIKVHFASLNTQDVERITGVVSLQKNNIGYGRDFSGITKTGDRIMGVVRGKAITSVIETLPDLIWSVPEHWTLEEAATVPLAYAQAFYCMRIKYDLKKNDKVLIHGGAEALGQAAISIALAYECTVFTTVPDASKKTFLLKLFPQLKDEYIGCSRDSSFSDMVLFATNGNGCEFVLCCVKEHLKAISLKCVAFWGVAIDTVQIESNDNFMYGMYNMVKCRSYKTVDFSCIVDPSNVSDINTIKSMITKGISDGWVRPLTHMTFSINETARASQMFATSRHRGRVLLKFSEAITSLRTRIAFHSESCHLVLWDGQAFGLEFVELLINRGANKILMYCTKPTSHHQLKLRYWKSRGIDIRITFDEDIDFKNIVKIIDDAQKISRIEGIYITSSIKFIKEMATTLCSGQSITELCPALKYAVAIAVHDSDENQFDANFMKNIFSLIIFPDVKEVNTQLKANINDLTWKNSALTAIEQAICSGYPVVNAHPYLIDVPSVIQQITKLLDANSSRLFLEMNLTLKELQIEPGLITAIGVYLKNMLHVTLVDEDIYMLNRTEILKMEREIKHEGFKEKKGLDVYFSYVDEDELRSTADVTVMDTLVTDTETMEQEMDVESTYLCIIPGLEGHHDRFRSLCERLKLPALVLQPGVDYPDENLQQLALRYSKVSRIDLYYLVTNNGVQVALELAYILEAKGLVGTVYCIGDDPEPMQKHVDEILNRYHTEDELKLNVALHIFSLMTNGAKPEQIPPDHYDWDRKIDIMRRQVECGSRSAQYVRDVINTVCSRIMSLRPHKPVPRVLQSKIIVLRTSNEDPSFLKNYSSPKLVKYELSVPLSCVLNDLGCSSIINHHLPKDVLDLFEMTNLCTSYLFADIVN